MSKEEIVNELNHWLAENDFAPDRARIDKYKDEFNTLKAASLEAQKAQFIEEGGTEDAFEYRNDPEDIRFAELMTIYRDKRKNLDQQKAQQMNANLAEKKALTTELQGLIQDEENIGKAYKRFNAIKQKWNEIGPVPNTERRDIQSEYSRLIELFYYNINIYRELQINDLKKNQELKMEMIEKIKLLDEEKSINQVDFLIHQYLDEWDEIGPTFKEEWEKIREEFRTEVGKAFDRIREHRKAVKDDHAENYNKKAELVQRVKELTETEFADVTELQKLTKSVIETQKEWKKIGFAGRSKNDKIWAEFRESCDAYFKRRDAFMEESNEELKKVKDAKRALIDRAKEIFESDDYDAVANELKGLQRQWKQAGKLLPHEEYKHFKEFRKYCDTFFTRKKKAGEELVKAAKENLQKKEQLLIDLNKAIDEGIKDKGEAFIDKWKAEWAQLGDVSPKMREKLEKTFDRTLTKAYKAIGISAAEVQEKQFESKLDMMSSSQDADHALSRERSVIIQKIRDANTNLAQEESKLDFFKYSDDSNPLKKELMQRIEKAQSDIDDLKEQKKRIDLTIKGLNQSNKSSEEEEETVESEDSSQEG